MKKNYLLTLLLILSTSAFLFAQDRKELNVPMADSGAIKIDGVMDEAAWGSAAEVNLVTSTEYNIFSLYYDRDGVTEPEYDEYYARLLWSRDTLYAFIHIDEVVNDSSGLYWAGQWLGDQLFVSLSSRLGRNMQGWYDGNVYAAPEGPYHYLILGDQVTLNNGAPTYLPDEYLKCSDMSDTVMVFDAADYAKWGITIDKATGVWNIEMAIYNPGISSQSVIGFNIGGSQGSEVNDTATGDAYMYYTWQPSIQNDPFADPYRLRQAPGFREMFTADRVARGPWISTEGTLATGILALPLNRKIVVLPPEPDPDRLHRLEAEGIRWVFWEVEDGAQPPGSLLECATATYRYDRYGDHDFVVVALGGANHRDATLGARP